MRFLKKVIFALYYVDECLLLSKTRKLSDELLTYFQEDFLCTDEGEADGCLGVEIKRTDSLLTLKKTQLIKRAMAFFGINRFQP